MDITVKTNLLQEKSGSTIAIANIEFADQFKVKNITVKEGKNGRFVSMPSVATSRTDEQGNTIYNDIFNPITAKGREELTKAVLDSLDTGSPIVIKDESKTNEISATIRPLENGINGAVGIGRLYLNDDYVVNSIVIKQASKGGEFVAFPSYKSNEVDEQGKAVYKDFAYPSNKESRDKITSIIMDAFNKAKEISKDEIVADEIKPKGVKAKLKEGTEKSKAASKNHKAPTKSKEAVLE